MMPSSHSLLSSGRLSWRSGLRHAAWAPSRCPLPRARVDREPRRTAGCRRLQRQTLQPWRMNRSGLQLLAGTLTVWRGTRMTGLRRTHLLTPPEVLYVVLAGAYCSRSG